VVAKYPCSVGFQPTPLKIINHEKHEDHEKALNTNYLKTIFVFFVFFVISNRVECPPHVIRVLVN